jgi:ribosome-binding protein aMBF1 (putative translation factor)
MNKTSKLPVRRQTAPPRERSAEELAELRAVRERFQREKPSLDQVLSATGQTEATTLGEYFQARHLLLALARERERQAMTLADLADKTGCDPAVLSRLFTGRHANPTLATVARIANALGKTVVHTLCDLPVPERAHRSVKGKHPAAPANGKTIRSPGTKRAAP